MVESESVVKFSKISDSTLLIPYFYLREYNCICKYDKKIILCSDSCLVIIVLPFVESRITCDAQNRGSRALRTRKKNRAHPQIFFFL